MINKKSRGSYILAFFMHTNKSNKTDMQEQS